MNRCYFSNRVRRLGHEDALSDPVVVPRPRCCRRPPDGIPSVHELDEIWVRVWVVGVLGSRVAIVNTADHFGPLDGAAQFFAKLTFKRCDEPLPGLDSAFSSFPPLWPSPRPVAGKGSLDVRQRPLIMFEYSMTRLPLAVEKVPRVASSVWLGPPAELVEEHRLRSRDQYAGHRWNGDQDQGAGDMEGALLVARQKPFATTSEDRPHIANEVDWWEVNSYVRPDLEVNLAVPPHCRLRPCGRVPSKECV